ncbi:hypothetical protein J1N35_003441 [Gossypium stocksii]|uniref:RNase H type-1 domain-containing protein n=1 Tax=Gossypium stocksii TaxID=47602 RepID=A0A9D3W9U5_9ROSI|nr:hypothetical protein J1N35_003441 [Gossypium stocksii]
MKGREVNENLSDPNYFARDSFGWDILFGGLCWNLWKRMNRFIFYGNFVELESVLQRSLQLRQQCIGAMDNANNNIISSCSRNVKLASWRKPNSGWYKLNIDGARVMLAWMSGQRSIDVVSMLTSDAKDGEINLIRKVRLNFKEWDVVIQHVYREGNKLVDGLALMAWGQALQSVFYYSPSVTLLD